MLFRDDDQIALSEVETACIEAADSHAAAAARVGDADLAPVFGALAQQRRALAAELAQQIRALDDLPKTPDPDRETIGQAFTGMKAMLSGDARRIFLEQGEHAERKLEEAVQSALSQSLPAPAEAVLHRMLAESAEARRRMAALRS